MNRRVEVCKLEEGYLVKAWTKTAPEAYAVQMAAQLVPPPPAFQPVSSGAFDPPEEPVWPSDATATWYPQDSGRGDFPPPCDGNNVAGDLLAQAQHEAAVDGDECTSGVCLLTRGSD